MSKKTKIKENKVREIKFRALSNNTKDWVYGSLIKGNNYDFIITKEDYDNVVAGFDTLVCQCHPIEKDSKTISQFTGLYDKDGKEIYEGDIVQDKSIYMTHLAYSKQGIETIEQAKEYINSGDIGTVSFCTDGSVASTGDFYDYFVGSGFKVNNVDLTCCEVIGNIYDNPELLEGNDE